MDKCEMCGVEFDAEDRYAYCDTCQEKDTLNTVVEKVNELLEIYEVSKQTLIDNL